MGFVGSGIQDRSCQSFSPILKASSPHPLRTLLASSSHFNTSDARGMVVLCERNPGLKQEIEEKVQGGVFHRDVFRVANGAVGVVPDGAVAFDLAQREVVLAANCAVAFNLPQASVVAVSHRTIAVNLAEISVAVVTYLPIVVDSGNHGVVAVPYSSIRVNLGYDGIVGVPDGLCKAGNGEAQKYGQYEYCPFHQSAKIRLFLYL